MASKKKKNVVRCVCCGISATGKISVEPVCDNTVCHVAVKEAIKSFIEENKKK